MFDNIGGKLKTLAQVLCWIGMGISAFIGVAVLVSEDPLNGLLIGGLGALGSWVSSLALYGFGQLIENSDKLVLLSKRAAGPQEADTAMSEVRVAEPKATCCPHCQGKITIPADAVEGDCPWCGKKLSF